MSPQGPQQPGVPPQPNAGGFDIQKFLQWFMARGALGKAAGAQGPTAPPVTPPVAPPVDPYAELRKAIEANPNNAPLASPDDLRVLAARKKKKK